MSFKEAIKKMVRIFIFPIGVSIGTLIYGLVKGIGFENAFTKASTELAFFALLILVITVVTR